MEKNNQYQIIERTLEINKATISSAITAVLDQDVSNYPIVVLHPGSANFGIPIIPAAKNIDEWEVNISSLEEFATKQIIMDDKVEEFMKIYKDPNDYYCFFFVHHLEAKFIFIKR